MFRFGGGIGVSASPRCHPTTFRTPVPCHIPPVLPSLVPGGGLIRAVTCHQKVLAQGGGGRGGGRKAPAGIELEALHILQIIWFVGILKMFLSQILRPGPVGYRNGSTRPNNQSTLSQ